MEVLFTTLNNKFKPQYNEIKSLQFHKLIRQPNDNSEECISRLRLKAVGYKCKEIDRQLKEQFIHGLNENGMLVEIIIELTKLMKVKM